ncbi:leucine-rich repeat domain-containing protein [Listeria grandensis]|uniref:Leucine-rich repeat domain-containing protein n=1 Tax=Listeria grandensis TaxID=1494963 RepID=A0A7X0Y2U5_9LIST|nr:immunoglobulin-like domain-containing protein [Listeria grandensis]MBC1935864.1 leucine-rich repeat domain-containing protein [Listeria grandensis]
MKKSTTTKFSKQLLCLTATMTITLTTIAEPAATMAQELTTKADNKIAHSIGAAEKIASAKASEVTIPDNFLRTELERALNISAGTSITQEMMSRLTSITTASTQIQSLEGMQYATNLSSLHVNNAQVSDVTPLKDLIKLKDVSLNGNKISDLSPLSDLTIASCSALNQKAVLEMVHPEAPIYNVTVNAPKNVGGSSVPVSPENISDNGKFNIITNQISWDGLNKDEGTTQFTWDLTQFGNNFSGIAVQPYEQEVSIPDSTLRSNIKQDLNIPADKPVYPSDMKKLTSFTLNNTDVASIEGMEYAVNLTSIYMNNNKITDITPLQKLDQLTTITLDTNRITDVAPLKDLTNVTKLDLGHNSILDLSPLEGKAYASFTALEQLITPETVQPEGSEHLIKADSPTDIDGNTMFILPDAISDDGIFNLITNQINWKNITQSQGTVQYVWNKDNFSGTYKQAYENKMAGTVTPNEFILGKDKYLTGTYTGDVAKVQLKVGEDTYSGGTVADGKISVYAYGKIKNTTDEVTIIALDKDMNKLDEEKVTVKTETSQGTITPDAFALGTDKYLEGTVTGDVAKVKLTVNGTPFNGGTVADGTFKVYAFDKIKNANDVVTITAYDKQGKELDSKTVTISALSGTVTPDAYTFGTSKYVTGSYTGDVARMELEVDGEIFKGGTVAEGKINFYAHGKIKATSQVVNVLVYDKNGKLLDTEPVSLNK